MNNTDGPFGPVVNGTQIVFFEYRPNKYAAYSFLVLFAAATLGHLLYLFILRAWFFIPFILGGIGEVFGYYGRAKASDDPNTVGPFILQNLLILASAPFLAATVYMSMGRITIALDAQRYSLISPRWLTKLYVLIDIGCIATQFIGSVIPASGDPAAIKQSRVILLAGLITQFVALTFFMFTCWHTYRGIQRNEFDILPSINWKYHFWAIEVVALLSLVRAIVRAVEYLQGEHGYVISHEIFIYLFDALAMWIVMVVFLVLHPGRLIRDARRYKSADVALERRDLI